MKSVKHSCSMHTLTAFFLLAIGAIISKSVAAEDSDSSSDAKVLERAKVLWSFQTIHSVAPPTPKAKSSIRNPVDAFIVSKLEASPVVRATE